VLSARWKQILRKDVVGSAVAVSLFLLFYSTSVDLFVIFFATNFGYSTARANALADWYWGFYAVALLVAGVLSDVLKVRKPFMLAGAVVSAAGVAMFAIATTHAGTNYYEFVAILLPIGIGSAFAFTAWMAAFTETVEKHNAAATVRGLAVFGATARSVVVVALLVLISFIPAASTLVGEGTQVAQAVAGRTPGLTASENATVKAVAADPTIPTRVKGIASQYTAELATAQKLNPQTRTALAASPTNPATQTQALGEISGPSAGDVAQVMTLSAQYQTQLATARAIDPATQATLQTDPANTTAQTTAVTEIAKAFELPPSTAVARLQALVAVPHADVVLLATDAKPVKAAAAQLTALSQVPGSDLALVSHYGPALQDPKVVAELKFLQANAPAVQQAKKQSAAQWQHWWWVCFFGQLVFLPFIWLLTGRWSPAKARQDANKHAEAVQRELAALTALAD